MEPRALHVGVLTGSAPRWLEVARALEPMPQVSVTVIEGAPLLDRVGAAVEVEVRLAEAMAAAVARAKAWVEGVMARRLAAARARHPVRLLAAAALTALAVWALWAAVVLERLALALLALLAAPAHACAGVARGLRERRAREAGCDVWLVPLTRTPLTLPGPQVLALGPGLRPPTDAEERLSRAARVHVDPDLAASGAAHELVLAAARPASFRLPGAGAAQRPDGAPTLAGVPAGARFVLTVAGPRPRPAHDALLRALPRDRLLVVVGSDFGPAWHDLPAERQRGWLGPQPEPVVAALAARAELVVLASEEEPALLPTLLAVVAARPRIACPEAPALRALLGGLYRDERTFDPAAPDGLGRLLATPSTDAPPPEEPAAALVSLLTSARDLG